MKHAGDGKNLDGWTLKTPRWKGPGKTLADPRIVLHREYLYPFVPFVATWTRDDGLTVEITVRVDQSLGPLAESVAVSGLAGGVAPPMRGLPIATMTKIAAARLAMEPASDGKWLWRETGQPVTIPMGPIRTSPARRSSAKSTLADVKTHYFQAISIGAKIGEYIARQMDVSRQHAYNLVRDARRAGLIPPTTQQGRKLRPDELKTTAPTSDREDT